VFDSFVLVGINVGLTFKQKFSFEGRRAGRTGMANGRPDFKEVVLVKTIEKPGERGVFVKNFEPGGLVEETFDVMVKVGFGAVNHLDGVGMVEVIKRVNNRGNFLGLGAEGVLKIGVKMIGEGIKGINRLATGFGNVFRNKAKGFELG